MIQLRLRVSGTLKTIDTIAERLDDLSLPLQTWNKYKRKQVQGVFDAGGPGWAPTKKSAGGAGASSGEGASGLANVGAAMAQAAKVRSRGEGLLRVKLQAELRRAQRKYVKSGSSSAAKSMQRRYAVLKEFERLAAGGDPGAGGSGDAKLDKSVRGLKERHARAVAKAASKPLGRMASSIKSKVEKYAVTVYSSVPWSGAHNEGATVGHGAKLPQRQFLDITDEDLAVLQILITSYVQGRG